MEEALSKGRLVSQMETWEPWLANGRKSTDKEDCSWTGVGCTSHHVCKKSESQAVLGVHLLLRNRDGHEQENWWFVTTHKLSNPPPLNVPVHGSFVCVFGFMCMCLPLSSPFYQSKTFVSFHKLNYEPAQFMDFSSVRVYF